ncbi:membrane protein insertase YidC [Lysinibacillus sp. fkY74-1]|uniref:Membrane protein insertase YidC n=3 Tax=Lysinibacillus TaxID=400634 RepID=B1HYQ6_LYSSC|nr:MULTISPECIES: membrane protein insertase YidC [Lysinibacillus]MBE5085421.1 membrane protein insertase YidC [Bacillus thuringiensis]ACA41779.1 Membrane protein oxaA precursor [Lysinibacillus sphaericus C3-41]AMO31926.1 OxaA precursor [Lysinibacillus sphaericus]AMR88955.1 OxaA precursor [Lysinibacillus sphaericus]ANA47026.1 OxaA precursor [Lysinibacillus sphaericus]
MKNLKLFSMLGLAVFVLSGCQAVQNKEGIFYSIFVKPMEFLLEFFGNDIFAGSYGLAIIAITVLIRLVLMPIMLKNYRQQQLMKTKMDAFKPEMEAVQKKMKEAKTKEEQTQYQQEMMALYQKHGINPLNMGCLPMLIQMPIIMGLYFSILYSTDVKSHEFLWFSLGSPDIVMTIVAGVVYLVQARVSLWTVPEQQKAQMKMFIYISPIMIVFISMSSMAALPLYWSVSGALLILQTYIGRKYYSQHPEKAK